MKIQRMAIGRTLAVLAAGIGACLFSPVAAQNAAPATPTPAQPAATQRSAPVDPKADAIIRGASEKLASAKQLTFEAYNTIDQMLDSGQKVQWGRSIKVQALRPGRLRATVDGDQENMEFVYDGARVSLLNRNTRCYGQVDVPATIDAMFDTLAEKYGMTLPLSDLLFQDPYQAMIGRVRTGQYLGVAKVFGQRCHHLAFRQDVVDWEIWIEDGGAGLPCKLVITYKEMAGHPQFTSYLSNWNLSPVLSDADFKFAPPADSRKVDWAAPAATQPASGQ